MAIGWLTALQIIPWSDVINNAPKVVDGAKKLWGAVGRKSSRADAQASSAPKTIAGLEAQIVALETSVSDLHNQMLESTELIKSLTEQNAQLVQRIEKNRVHMLWLCAATAAALLAALIGLL